MEDLGL